MKEYIKQSILNIFIMGGLLSGCSENMLDKNQEPPISMRDRLYMPKTDHALRVYPFEKPEEKRPAPHPIDPRSHVTHKEQYTNDRASTPL